LNHDFGFDFGRFYPAFIFEASPLKTGEQLFAGSIGNRFPDLRDVENRGTSDDSAIVRAVGEEGARFFKQSFELKIKGDLIPEAAVEELIGGTNDDGAIRRSSGGG
jgi:hypothetical protein